MKRTGFFVLSGVVAAVAAVTAPAMSPPPEPGPGRSSWITAVDPKPLSAEVERGLKWLVEHQHESGGWGQGDTSLRAGETAKPNVGDTCVATLALLRSGSTASEGPYAPAIRKALRFIMGHVERSGPKVLSVTNINGTRLQAKLGPNIDTFLASLVLTEATGTMPDTPAEDRLAAALDKVLYKIQVNQDDDGLWKGRGWAPALANALAVKTLNRARQKGIAVSDEVLAKAEANAMGEFAAGRGMAAGKGGAGVALYGASKNIGVLSDSVATNRERAKEVKVIAKTAPTAEQRNAAEAQLRRFAGAELAFADARNAVVQRLSDEGFVAGFGSNGGEEFLSYVNIGESLLLEGGDDWARWDDKISRNLTKVQNADGSWTGHHCITGRTFCTSSALLVLMGDRTLMPPEAIAAARAAPDPEPEPEPDTQPEP